MQVKQQIAQFIPCSQSWLFFQAYGQKWIADQDQASTFEGDKAATIALNKVIDLFPKINPNLIVKTLHKSQWP